MGVTSQVTVIVTGSCDLEKDIEEHRTNNVIQYSKSMLIL